MKMFRRIALLPLIAVALVSGAPHAFAAADNTAVAINSKDDTYVAREAFKITQGLRRHRRRVERRGRRLELRTVPHRRRRVPDRDRDRHGDERDLGQSRDRAEPGCLSCATYAGAFQLIVTPHTQMRFTESGNEQIDQVREELHLLVDSATFGPTFEEIDAFNTEVDALFERLKAVVAGELVVAGGGNLIEDVDVETV